MIDPPPGAGAPSRQPSADFERLIGELRPKLHRYCARMTGSAIDGEDVVQEALAKLVRAAGPDAAAPAHRECRGLAVPDRT